MGQILIGALLSVIIDIIDSGVYNIYAIIIQLDQYVNVQEYFGYIW